MITQISKIEIEIKTSRLIKDSIRGMITFKIFKESSQDCRNNIWFNIVTDDPENVKDVQYNNLTEMLK